MNRLKEIRQKNCLTLEKLGQKVNIPKNTLSRYESGKREPKIETWKKLADYFNVSTSYLMGLNNNSFGNRIKELRIKNGLSQGDLAEKIGVKANTICQYEKGKRHPKIETWQKIANALNTSVVYARGDIDTELIAKIAKLLLCLIEPSMDFLIDDEIVSEENKTLYEEMLLITLIDELGLNTEQIVEELKQKMWKSDFIKVLCENGSEYAIKGGTKLVQLYDKL